MDRALSPSKVEKAKEAIDFLSSLQCSSSGSGSESRDPKDGRGL